MVEMRLKRTHLNPNCTIGLLYINKQIVCFTLEDKVREIPDTPVEAWKVPKETAIPKGEYKVSLNYSNRFKKVLPILHEVPGFTGIRIHSGNSHSDTEGCILVGNATNHTDFVSDSRAAMRRVMELLEGQSDITIKVE